jgi:hypothetical protein
MNQLYWEAISPAMRQLLNAFGASPIGEKFYLAGGTALALHLGHRISVDLDFFSQTEDISMSAEILQKCLAVFSPQVADTAWGNLVLVANGVRIGFYGYGYDLLEPLVQVETIRLASITDIALMKMDALLARASRKDFLDLYVICQQIPLRKLLDLAPSKYPSLRDYEAQVVRHMVYFERAEQETPVPMLQDVSWKTVKTWFKEQAVLLGKDWFGE